MIRDDERSADEMGQKISIHPGEVLLEEWAKPLKLGPAALAARVGLPEGEVIELLNCQRAVTPQLARKLAEAFSTTAEFWVNLQAGYDRARRP